MTNLTAPQSRTLAIIAAGDTSYGEVVTVRRGRYVGQGVQATGWGNGFASQGSTRIKGFSSTAAFNLVRLGLVKATKYGTEITSEDITKKNIGRRWSWGWIFTVAAPELTKAEQTATALTQVAADYAAGAYDAETYVAVVSSIMAS